MHNHPRRPLLKSCRRIALALMAAGTALTGYPALAGPTVLEKPFFTGIANGWVQVERWRDTTSAIGQETFPPDGRGDQSGQRATFFGSGRPSSARFLMYYAPGWDTNIKPVPVLLVHGANQEADLAWANPNSAGGYGCGQATCPTTGLMQALSSDGFKVFALGLAHKNGDGYIWAEEIADAIAIIKTRTGAAKVDVIGWSKAAPNARMYVSGVRQSWGTAYRGDVRRLILLGSPNNGIDLSFRHGWNFSLVVYPACGGTINGPTPHDHLVCYGVNTPGSQWTYSSPYFPGSAQLLKRWDSVYPLPTSEQDWYTTYYGGQGVYSSGPGISAYLSRSLVDVIRNAPVPLTIREHSLCGDLPTIALLHNEHTGPSDGVVFVASCRDSTGISYDGGGATLDVNHLGLGWDPLSITQIRAWLNAN
jgi:hypothetical protein